jgi:hypothetical protein
METMDNVLVNFMAEANLNKAHQIMTYLTLLLFPTIKSWLLTKLANVSHDLTRQWEIGVESLLAGGSSPPQDVPQEEESRTT